VIKAPVICTIIAKNYLAFARVLCSSFLQHHPGGKCYVLVIDDWQSYINPAKEQFELVSLSDINLPERPEIFCFQYNITELSTAVKPFLLRWLIEQRGETEILYLDPDILVTSSLDGLYSRLRNGGGVLVTPHLDKDYPRDGKLPDDAWILATGIFNLGFLGIAANNDSLALIAWLEDKLSDRCVMEPEKGYFVDQRFLDLAITLFPFIEIERSVAYNVAYWNLHSRFLKRDGGVWFVNNDPLRFFHFSNYKPEQSNLISGHLTRYRLDDRPDLQPLFESYRQQLLNCGYDEASKWPYSFGRFPNGRKVSDFTRKMFRRRMKHRFTERTDPFQSKRIARQSILFDFINLAARATAYVRIVGARLVAGQRGKRNS
jgi:lipopolysaccharide biosynthesis glycosyltransferase